MSTAYCHLDQQVLKEDFYPPFCDPHNVIKTAEWLQEDILNSITKEYVSLAISSTRIALHTEKKILLIFFLLSQQKIYGLKDK